MVTNYLIPESNQSGLNGNIDPKSLKGKSMEELLQMKKEKEASIEQDKKLLLKNDTSEKVKKRHERFLRFDVEDLTHINAEIDSRKQATPAPATPSTAPVTPPTPPAPVTPPTPPAANPIVPPPVTPADTSTKAGGNTNTYTGGSSSTNTPTGGSSNQGIGQNHLTPTTPATNNEEESKTGFFTPTNILLMLLVVGGGIFFMTRKGK